MNIFACSPKRQQELEKTRISDDFAFERKLVRLCKTQWVTRIDALEVFFDFFPFVVQTFDAISEGSAGGWNTDSSRQAASVVSSITKFPL